MMIGKGVARRKYIILLNIVLIHGVLAIIRNTVAQHDGRPATRVPRFCLEFVFPYGYSCEEFKVQTEDGYILALHRLGNWHFNYPRPSTAGQSIDEPHVSAESSSQSPQAGTNPGRSMHTPRGLFEKKGRPRIIQRRRRISDRFTIGSSVNRVDDKTHSLLTKLYPMNSVDNEDQKSKNFQYNAQRYLQEANDVESMQYAEYNLLPDRRAASERTLESEPALLTPISIPSLQPSNSGGESNVPNSSPSVSPSSWPTVDDTIPFEQPVSLSPDVSVLTPAFSPDEDPYSSTLSSPLTSPSDEDPHSSTYSSPLTSPSTDLPLSGHGLSTTPLSEPFVQSSSPTSTSVEPETYHRKHCRHRDLCKQVPVLLMHPEFLNGDSWFIHADSIEDKLLPLMLVDGGFDVWIGHHRATFWGQDHVKLESTDPAYWDWTWDEQAQYDIPALLGFLNEKTRDSVHFIGVSQSATAGAAASTRPEVSRMMKSMTLLGPTIYRGNKDALVLEAWAYMFGIRNYLDEGHHRQGHQNGPFNFSMEFPANTVYTRGSMAMALNAVSGPNCCLGTPEFRFDNGWDGTTSLKNLLHFQQGVRSNSWQHFVYENDELNSEAYNGNIFPPFYNPGDIPKTLPVFVLFGDQDAAAPLDGVRQFLFSLKGHPEILCLKNYAHLDMTFSVNRTHAIYEPILHFLQRQEAHFERLF